MKNGTVLRETGVLTLWLFALVLVCGVLWYVALPARNMVLARSVNAYLEASGEKIRLGAPVALSRGTMGRAAGVGERFTLQKSTDTAVVFLLFTNGATALCAAVVNDQGTVLKILPLSKNSSRLLATTLPGLVATYVRRIELAESRARGDADDD